PAGLVPDSTVTGGGVTVGVGVSGVQAAINTMSNKMAARRIHTSSESMRTPLDEFYQNKTEIAFLNLTPASLRSTPPLHCVERGSGGEVNSVFICKTTSSGHPFCILSQKRVPAPLSRYPPAGSR